MDTSPLIILFADDDPDDFYLLKDGLLDVFPNHTLHYISDGTRLVDTAKELKPDLIFLDYNMPLCDGTKCLQSLKEDPQLQHIPVVMYSTSSMGHSVNDSYNFGAARYLIKPFNYSAISSGLRIIFDLYNNQKLITPSFEEFLVDTNRLQ